MKLRVRDSSLRLRLSRSEVKAIAERRPVQGVVVFGGARRLVYVLESSSEIDTMTASFDLSAERATITVRIPELTALAWADSETVSLHGSMQMDAADEPLSLLVEKDFACLSPADRGEDESDMYPHPEAGSASPHC